MVSQCDLIMKAKSKKDNRFSMMKVLKMAYRKHVLEDDSIGWNELSDALGSVLAIKMGDDKFVKWVDEVEYKGKPIV